MTARLDYELVRRGLASSRERAKEYIQTGSVTVNGNIAKKPSDGVSEDDVIILTGETLKYVGRGGLKLEGAINSFSVDLSDKTCLDIGASTGGFTDCMLQFGAKKVYAVDVGHGQLVEKLRADERVVNIEGVNVKDLTHELIREPIDFISADLSFISVRYAADAANLILRTNGEAVLLIKPQFEAGRKNLSKTGIVHDRKVHTEVLESLCGYFQSLGFEVKGLEPSPIKGGDGNIEYLVHLVKSESFTPHLIDYGSIVQRAFAQKG